MKGGGDSSSGFIAEAEAQPEVFELVPVYLATANPSGLISAKCWATLRKELLEELKRTMDRGRIDCIALHLHGAGVSEDSTDLEGLLLEDIRRLVGPNVVIVANLDLHAKMTRRMHENVDMINSVLTYPHIDHNPRSRELLRLVPAVLQKKMKPVRWVERIPFVLVSAPTVPNLGFLMSDVREMCESAMRRPGILDASVGHGFPFSDIPDAGVHVWVTSDGQPELAKRVALEIADFIWKNKERALPKLTMPEDGVKKAMDVLRSQGRLDIYAGGKGGRKHPGTYGFVPDEDSKGGPVMLVDSADNPGGGSAGDNTYLLKAMWESKVERAAFVGLIDAELVAKVGRASYIDGHFV